MIIRTETYRDLEEIDEERNTKLSNDIIKEVEISLKYEGYIKMQEAQVI